MFAQQHESPKFGRFLVAALLAAVAVAAEVFVVDTKLAEPLHVALTTPLPGGGESFVEELTVRAPSRETCVACVDRARRADGVFVETLGN
jgi:hypothetical protein